MVNQAERGVRLGKRIVQFHRLLGSSFRPRQILLRRARSVNREQGACIGDARAGQRVGRVLVSGLPKVVKRFLEILGGSSVPEIVTFEIILMALLACGGLPR